MPLRKAAAAAREMLVTAAAQRWKVDPSACHAEKGFVLNTSTGRKLSYGALVDEAAKLAVPSEPVLKKPTAFHLIGKPMARFDGPAIVEGRPLFTADLKIPDMKIAVIARCPVLGGKVKGSNAERVKAMPGVRAVVAVPSGIAVVADSTFEAIRAREALSVDWDLGPHATFSSDALRGSLQALLAAKGFVARSEGDAEKRLSEAARKLDAVYEFPFQAHATMEPPTCIADVREGGCEIWVGSQNPNPVQDRVSRLLGLRPEQVKIHITLLGGGFGRRLAWDFPMEAVEVSKAAGMPVKLFWTREDDLAHDWFHPMSLHRLEAGLDAAGRPIAWRHRVAAPSILLSWMEGKRNPNIPYSETNGAYDTPYFLPHFQVEYLEAPLHFPLGWWRSIQAVPNTFARECFVDELAAASGKDPVAFRLELMGAGRMAKIGQDSVDIGRLRRVLQLAAEKSGWGRPLPKGHFQGVACAAFHGSSYAAEVAEISVSPAGKLKVEKITAALDIGRVVNPWNAQAQVESGVVWGLSALRTQITFKEGRVQQVSLSDLPVFALEEMPQVDTHFVPSEADPSGLGEPPVLPVIPAVLNALAAATGKRVRRLPLLPSDFA
jgi:isoquinoline 1-oxidoreductase beta subunit